MDTQKDIGQELLEAELRPFEAAMEAEKITPALLARQLKSELRAKKTITQKLKGATNEVRTAKGNMKRGLKIIATTGIIETDPDGGRDYGTGETLLAIDMIDWQIRQKARMDAHKLRGDYPAEKHEHSGPGGGPIEHSFTATERAARLTAILDAGRARRDRQPDS